MQKELRRSIISGKAYAQPSLPSAKRAALMATLTPGQTIVSGVPQSQDFASFLSICRSLGADIVEQDGKLDIFGIEELSLPKLIGCGTSASNLALFMPLALLFEEKAEFAYDGIEADKAGAYAYYLSALCGNAPDSETQPSSPFLLSGPLQNNEIVYPSELGSALLCGLAISLPLGKGETTIGVDGLLPGEGMLEGTLDMMGKSGIAFTRIEDRALVFSGSQVYSCPEAIDVPARSCEPSYFLLAGALCGKVEVEGMQRLPALDKVFSAFGCQLTYSEGKYISSTGGLLEGGYVDAYEAGDFLLHALVLGALSLGKTSIVGMAKLRDSQKRRAVLLCRELSRMGARITPTDLGLDIEGGNVSGGVQISPSGHAHVAMACAVAALAARQPCVLFDADCVEKAHQGFFRKLSLMGGIIRESYEEKRKFSALSESNEKPL